MIRSSVPTKLISRIFISVTSGQVIFAASPALASPLYLSQRAKNQLRYIYFGATLWVESHCIGQLLTIQVKNSHCPPLERSFEVTRGHQLSFANNYWSKRVRNVGLVSARSSRPGKSTDMQYDPFRSPHDLGMTWLEVKLWTLPFKVILYRYGWTRLNETNRMV